MGIAGEQPGNTPDSPDHSRLRQRESSNATGVVAALLEAETSGYISHDECTAMIALMIFAGHETTSNLLAIGLYELLRHRAQWDVFCEDPSLAPQAVEELLRFVTPAHFLPYVAAQDRELDGVAIKRGGAMIGVLAAANRDPEDFERPDLLDITRADSKNHVSFGFGPHFCLGAALARMEATILFGALAERFPRVEPVTESLTWGGSGSLRTPLALPVRLRP